MAAIGDRIVSTIDSLRQHGLTVDQRTRGGDTIYTIGGASYHIVVTVNPIRWVGLHFGLGPADHKAELTYDIDTDLYDLAHPRFTALARSVEDEIVAFLEALMAGKVLIGKVGRRPALLVPVGRRTVVITKGITRSTKVRRASSTSEVKGEFVPLV